MFILLARNTFTQCTVAERRAYAVGALPIASFFVCFYVQHLTAYASHHFSTAQISISRTAAVSRESLRLDLHCGSTRTFLGAIKTIDPPMHLDNRQEALCTLSGSQTLDSRAVHKLICQNYAHV